MRYFSVRGSVYLADERGAVSGQESSDPGQSRHERVREVRMRRVADYYEHRDPMLHYRAQFVGFVPDAAIVRQGNPSPLPDRSKPYLVGAIVREVISVALYG